MEKIARGTEVALFDQLVREGEERLGHTLDENMRAFLALAIWRMAKLDNGDSGFQDRLASFLAAAQGRLPPATSLRIAGDSALLLAGWFPTHCHRTCVSPEYYVAMGRTAYHRLGALDRAWDWRRASERFPRLVDVLLAIPPSPPLDAWTAASLANVSAMARRFLALRNVVSGGTQLQ